MTSWIITKLWQWKATSAVTGHNSWWRAKHSTPLGRIQCSRLSDIAGRGWQNIENPPPKIVCVFCRQCQCAPNYVYFVVFHLYRVMRTIFMCFLFTVCTLHSAYSSPCVLCTVCTVQYVKQSVCTVSIVQYVQCPSSTLFNVWIVQPVFLHCVCCDCV